MTIAPFGWKDGATGTTPPVSGGPSLDAANLEAMHAAAGAYADLQLVVANAYTDSQISKAMATVTGWSGVDNTGATDSSTGLFNAIEDARGRGRTLWINDGTYLVNSRLYSQANVQPIAIRGNGPGRTIIRLGVGLATDILGCLGTLTAAAGTITSGSIGSNVVVLSSTTGISAGQTIVLRDTTQIKYSNATRIANGVAGEFVTVKSVDSGTQLTLYHALRYTYAAGDVRILSGYETWIRDLTIIGPGPVQGYTGSGIVFTNFQNVHVENVEFRNMCTNGIYFQNGCDATVTNPIFDTFYDIETTNAPYCISAARCLQGLKVSGGQARYGRHFITGGSTPGELPASDVDVSDCQATGFSTAFDTHPGGERFKFRDCHSYGNNGNANNMGFQLRGPDCACFSCTVDGADTGASVIWGDRFRWVGGRVSNTRIGIAVQDTDRAYIGGAVEIDGARSNAIVVRTTDAAYSSFVSTVRLGEVHIDGTPNATGGPVYNQANLVVDSLGPVFMPDATMLSVNYTPTPAQLIDSGVLQKGVQVSTVPWSLVSANAALLTSGVVYGCIVKLPAGLQFSNFCASPHTAVTVQTHFWMALLDATVNPLTVLAVSVDKGSTLLSGSPPVVAVNGNPYVVPYTGYYLLVMCCEASTMGTWNCTAAQTSGMNSVVVGSIAHYGTMDTLTGGPPAVGATLSTNPVTSGQSQVPFMGVG